MHIGKETGLEVLAQVLVPALTLTHSVTLDKFLHLPRMLFLSCKCHAAFDLFAATVMGKRALGNITKEGLLALLSSGGDLRAQTLRALWISLSSSSVNFPLLLANPAVTM